MYQIKKVRIDCTVDFAAEELKKYLCMMMPDAGYVPITCEPGAANGFRLGTFEDFGIPFEGTDTALDDVVHIETDEKGGILAGSNPRSVLFAVYRYLKENGCRFLFPGADGEYIPCKPVQPVSYHHMASYRYRGHTTEGGPSFEHALLYIDYMAKQEMNVYGLYETYSYHRRYYIHKYNSTNRPAEPVSRELVKQWEAACQAEILKRGMQLWAGGHGWVAKVVGIDLEDRYLYKEGKKPCPEEVKPNLAMLGGERKLNRNDPVFTNFCMSRQDLRAKYTALMADYLETNPQLDQVSVSLADTSRNHCECPECQKKRPSDWLVILLNEVDAELTRRNISTRLQCSAYVDCMFPPVEERFNNPDRFVLKATPIARKYTSSLDENTIYPPIQEYVRNHWKDPKSTAEYFSAFRGWQKVFPGDTICYEYHYWKHQYRDPGAMAMSRRVYEDVRSWKILNMQGGIEDGSNKSFFPNGFIDYIYGATLLDSELDYEAALEDYFSHIYGPDWKKVRAYLNKVTETFDHSFMCGQKSADLSKGEFYNPAIAPQLEDIKEYAAEIREIIATHKEMPTRPQTVSWRLLLRHTEYVEGFAKLLSEVCLGHKKYAMELFRQFCADFGKYDFEIERYMDMELALESIFFVVRNIPTVEF